MRKINLLGKMEELDEIIRRCLILDCKMIVVVPSENITVHATRAEIREDAVAVLKEMVKKIFVWHLNDMEDMPCDAPYNTDEKRLWPGDARGCLDHQRYADVLKKIGFEGGCCTVEVFRPDYYELTQEENVKTAAAVTRSHVETYWLGQVTSIS